MFLGRLVVNFCIKWKYIIFIYAVDYMVSPIFLVLWLLINLSLIVLLYLLAMAKCFKISTSLQYYSLFKGTVTKVLCCSFLGNIDEMMSMGGAVGCGQCTVRFIFEFVCAILFCIRFIFECEIILSQHYL